MLKALPPLRFRKTLFQTISLWAGIALSWPGLSTASPIPLVQVRESQARSTREAVSLEIEGTVTYCDPARDLVVLQDSSGALAVRGTSETLSVGERVNIQAAAYAPFLTALEHFPFKPDKTELLSILEIDADDHRFYIDRFRGRLVVPADGEYTFFLSADDDGELWFSPDASPEHAEKIAMLTEWTDLRDYTRYPSQKSAPIYLKAGQVCYIECLHEQQQGHAALSVAWSGPGIDRARVGSGGPVGLGAKTQSWSELPPGIFLREIWERAEVGDLTILSQIRKPCDEVVLHGVKVIRLGSVPVDGSETLQKAIELQRTYDYCSAEGTADEISTTSDGLQFQLVSNDRRYTVKVIGSFSPQELDRLERTKLRLTGVYRPLTGQRAERPAAELLLASASQIDRLGLNANWDELPVLKLDSDKGSSAALKGERKKIQGRVVSPRPDGSFEMKDEGYFVAYASPDGKTWTQLGPELSLPLGDTIQAGFLLAPHTGSARAAAVFDEISGVGEKLKQMHVGEDDKEGTVERTKAQIKLAGYGGDTWNFSDDFQFYAEPVEGSRDITARIAEFTTPHPQGRAGIMMRESLLSRSAFTEVVFDDHKVEWIFRSRDPGSRAIVQGGIPAALPFWIRLHHGFHTIAIHPRSAVARRVGDNVEVAGYPEIRGRSVEMDGAVVREISSSRTRDESASVRPLVSIGQVANVPNDQRPNALRLRGTVTYTGTYRGHYYLSVQDDTGAIFLPNDNDPDFFRPHIGQMVDVYGAPVFAKIRDDLNVTKVVPIEDSVLPTPVHHPAELLFSGNGAAYWTEVEGVIYKVDQTGTAFLRCNSGVMSVAIEGKGADFWKVYTDCLIRIRGVIAYPSPTSPCLLVPDASFLTALEPIPRPTTNIPLMRLRDVSREALTSSDKHRVRISGVITLAKPGLVMMQDEGVGIAIQVTDPSNVKVGETAEALGFPSANGSMMLLESEVKSTGQTAGVNPKFTLLNHLRSRDFDGILVNVPGFLIREKRWEAGQVLELQDNSGSAVGVLMARGELAPEIPPESRVVLTGVCVPLDSSLLVQWELPDLTNAVRVILLRSNRDIRVIEHPRWWRLKRTAQALGILIVTVSILFAWIYILRQRVAQRTEQLAFAMAQLKKETEVSTLLAERNRLAGEIHDSVEQGFSAVLLQLDVANRLKSCSDELRKSLNLAHTMLVFSRAELRNTVWDLYSSEVEAVDLPRALRRIVAQFESDIVELTFNVFGNAQKLSQATEHELVRIAQEAITNAVKHAQATTISVVLDYKEGSVSLRIVDDGRGFSPELALTSKDGHFGLRSMKTRAKKIPGQLKIISEPGLGCTVHVHILPA